MLKKFIAACLLMATLFIATHGFAANYLANTKSGIYHIYSCSTIKYPNAPHFVPYESALDAEADGYRACQRCLR